MAATNLAPPYVEATMDQPPANRAELARFIAGIIATEAPVHGDALTERLRLLLGPDTKTFAPALNEARLLHGVREAGSFWFAEDSRPAIARDRRAAAAHLRRPAMIHPDEVLAGARVLLELDSQANEDELAAGLTRLFGLEGSATPALAARLAMLLGSGNLVLPPRA